MHDVRWVAIMQLFVFSLSAFEILLAIIYFSVHCCMAEKDEAIQYSITDQQLTTGLAYVEDSSVLTS